jgi:hypothetical protein
VPADDGIVLDVPAAVDALSLWHGSGTPHCVVSCLETMLHSMG